VLLALLAEPYVTILFERGLFDAEATALVACGAALLCHWPHRPNGAGGGRPRLLRPKRHADAGAGGGLQIAVMWALSLWFRDALFPALGWRPLGGLALGFQPLQRVGGGGAAVAAATPAGWLGGRALLDGAARMARQRW
jgi:hypothetical protein